MSIFTREGYHNYHHTFANDYRNGSVGTTFTLPSGSSGRYPNWGGPQLARVSHMRIQERIVIEKRDELIDVVKNYLSVNSAMLEEKIEKTTRDILSKFSDFYRLTQEYKTRKKEAAPDKDLLKDLNLQIESLKKTMAEDWEAWNRLREDIMRHTAS